MAEFKKIKDAIERLKKATSAEQDKALLRIIKQNETALLDLNRSQLMEGINPKGEQLRPYRSKAYAAYKKKLNPNGVTDLKLTGRLHGRMFIDTTKFPIVYDSADSKKSMLEKEYGSFLGLTEENKEKAAEEILKDQILLYYADLFRL